MKFEHPKTAEILKWFEEISKIPRCSKHEEKISAWLQKWAKEHELVSKQDEVGNLLIKVPATKGYENSGAVVIQGHLDMVCEKTPDSTHDFTKDAIKFVYDNNILTADRTTLGADNGIAIAMALALALDKEVSHPALELLFTVDEETGLTGATALKPGFVEGKILLNVDSEDEGVFTVGCAGGKDTKITLPVSYIDVPKGKSAYLLEAGGMKGGHSGVDINLQRANAIKVLAHTLDMMIGEVDFNIAAISGGTAHNAIPRDAQAVIVIDDSAFEKAKKLVSGYEAIFKHEFDKVENNLFLLLKKSDKKSSESMLSAEYTRKTIDILLAIPHGVDAMSTAIEGLVETSNNLAEVSLNDKAVLVHTSQRSSVMSRLDELTKRIEAIGRLSGGTHFTDGGYPAWEANWDSRLLEKCKNIYKKNFGKEPVVEVIHAGLECGIIGDANPGMDMISFGPTIKNPHSPDEFIEIDTIGKVWDLMGFLLADLK